VRDRRESKVSYWVIGEGFMLSDFGTPRHTDNQPPQSAFGMLCQGRAVRADGPPIRLPPCDMWHLARRGLCFRLPAADDTAAHVEPCRLVPGEQIMLIATADGVL
jgi:hypothetical protein